ncbi:zinc finger protein 593 homolog [Artemia franciscana]|uniref:Zinc finger protein 593 homolog n=1 Tax=Artemia franciscana TaxID=6661 RepID=A0AA88HS94_ARTSF|nr:hypothetical protein QYM36_011635 [Artemia franciscana]
MTYKRKKYHRGETGIQKKYRLKRKTKDLDEIDADLKAEVVDNFLNQPIDLEKAGGGQFYCVHCARYFIDDQAIKEHFRSKVHKRRLKALELEPYSVEESLRAAGQGNYIPPKKRVIETLFPKALENKIEEKMEEVNELLNSM